MKPACITALLSLFFVCVSCAVSGAQTRPAVAGDPYFVESRDTVSEYGPWHITRDMVQAHNGDIWFATWLGIIQYNGRRFINHTLKDGLVHFHVVCCHKDSKGNLWFGTARGGVYRYDGTSFRLFTAGDGLIDNNVACIYEDRQGNTWFGTEKGASRFDGKTFTGFAAQQGLTDGFVNSIVQDRAGTLYFGATDGLYVFDGQTFTRKQDMPMKGVLSMMQDRHGNMWIGGFDGCLRYNGISYTRFLTNKLTCYFAEDKAGNIWLTHSEKNTAYPELPNQVMYKYDGKGFKKIIEKDQPNDFQLFGKIADRDGNIWFGTMHGVCRYDGSAFFDFRPVADVPATIPNK